ncbi:PTS sugar transporter subunit IIA [Lapidilactobacillus salsurivasis]
MKLGQREIDLLRFALNENEKVTVAKIQKKLKLSANQIHYALGKINYFLKEKKLGQIFIIKDCLVIDRYDEVKKEIEFFISHTTPEQFKYTAEQIKYFIELKLLLADERVPINYFVETLSASRTTIVNTIDQITDEFENENILLSNVARKGYLIEKYDFRRFSYFIEVLKKMINIREIYSFYYQDNIYSKTGDLVFFDIFDLDILFSSLDQTILFSRKSLSEIDDTNFLFLMILNYKYLELIKHSEITARTKKLQIISGLIDEAKQNNPSPQKSINLARRLNRYIDRELSDTFEMNNFKVESPSLINHIQRFIFRYENNIPFHDLDSGTLMGEYKNLYYVIFTAIQTFQNGIFEDVEASEAALITLYYINEIEQNAPKAFKSPRILIICGEGRAISSVLKSKVSNLIDSDHIDTTSVFKFEAPMVAHYDLIISTVRLPEVDSEKILYSDKAFSDDFFVQIKHRLLANGYSFIPRRLGKLSQIMNAISEEVHVEINMTKLESKIIKILASNLLEEDQPNLPDFIFDSTMLKYHQSQQTWQSAIRLSASELLAKKSIDPKYTEKIISNIERFGPYMIITPGILLAHAGEQDGVIKNGFSMHVFHNPIAFPGKNVFPVSVIITIAVKDHRSYPVVEKIVQWVLDDETIFSLTDEENRKRIENKINNILRIQEVQHGNDD